MNQNVNLMLKNLLNSSKQLTQAVDKQNDVSSTILTEMTNIANRVEKSEMISMLAAEISLEALEEIKSNECFSNAQCALMQKSVQDKATEFTDILYGDLSGRAYTKKWGYVVRGLWTIYKNHVNEGSKAPYNTTLKIKFDAAVDYVNSLTLEDYLAHRRGNYHRIKQFEFSLPLDKKAYNIQEIIEERLNNKIEAINDQINNTVHIN